MIYKSELDYDLYNSVDPKNVSLLIELVIHYFFFVLCGFIKEEGKGTMVKNF